MKKLANYVSKLIPEINPFSFLSLVRVLTSDMCASPS